MRSRTLYRRLLSMGIELYLRGDAIRHRGPKGALTPDLRDAVRENQEILRSSSIIREAWSAIGDLWLWEGSESESAWNWIKSQPDLMKAIEAAESDLEQCYRRGDPEDTRATCQRLYRIWRHAIKECELKEAG